MADVSTVSVLLQVKDQMSAGLKNAEGRLNKLGGAVQKHRQGIRNAGLAIGGALTGFAALAIKNASDLNESMNAVNVVFGEGSKVIQDFGKNSATAVGLSQAKFNQLAASTGALLNRTGKPLAEVAGMTTDLATRAADLASVYNTEVDEAMSAINQALRGETEAIRRFGGEVSEAALQQFLMSQGINKSSKELTAQEKRLYRVQLIMSDTAGVAGDFAKTSGDVANQMRIAKEQFADTSAKLGMALLPAMSNILNIINKVMTATAKWVADNPKLASAIMKTIAVVGPLAIGIGILATSVFALNLAFSPIGLILVAVAAAVVGLIAIFVKWDDMSVKLKVTLVYLLGPIGLLIVAIKEWDKIVAVLRKGFALFITGISKGINFLLKLVRAVVSVIPGMKDMTAAIDENIRVNEEAAEKYNRTADHAMRMAFKSEEAGEIVSDSSKKTATAVGDSNGAMQASTQKMSEGVSQSMESASTGYAEGAKSIQQSAGETSEIIKESKKLAEMSHDEFVESIKQSNAEYIAAEELATQLALAETQKRMEAEVDHAKWLAENRASNIAIRKEQENKDYQDRLAETQRWLEAQREAAKAEQKIQEELAAAEKKIVDERLEYFRGNVKEREEQLARLMQAQSGSVMFDDPWSDEMGRGQDWKAQLEGDALRDKKAEEEKQKIKEATDPLRDAMKEAGTTYGHFLTAFQKTEKAAMQGGLQMPGQLTREERMKDPEFIAKAKQLMPQIFPQERAALEAMLGGVTSFANGGISHGGRAIVGERGPEMVSLPAGSRVHRSGSGMGSNTFIFHGAVYGVEDLKRVVVEAVRDHALSGGFTGVFGEA